MMEDGIGKGKRLSKIITILKKRWLDVRKENGAVIIRNYILLQNSIFFINSINIKKNRSYMIE